MMLGFHSANPENQLKVSKKGRNYCDPQVIKFLDTEIPCRKKSVLPLACITLDKFFFCIRWPDYWSFSFSISPSNEYSGLISFRMDWLHLLALQGTFKSLLQHHSSKVSILQCSALFMGQLSPPYMTTGKTIALTRWIFLAKQSLLFNTAYRFVKAFLPRSKHLLFSWLQSLSAVILEPKKIKSVTVSIVSHLFAMK